ncbi:MAG: alpha/beta fold hydrolase [Myxococcales bacterium]|nr:alpha/beta fold hydrolase [Myxococcales bacterium]
MVAVVRQNKSTNVRVYEALDDFLRPPRAARPAREHALLAVADQAAVLPSGVRAWSWGAGPVVLLAHGWGGRGAQLAALAAALVEHGRRVVTFDAPAHGDSPGERATLDAFAVTLAEVAAWAAPVDAIVAHSFGAAATTIALARGLAVARVAFVAPLFQVAASVERFLAHRGLAGDERARFQAGLAAANHGHDAAGLDGPALAPRMAAPLLVVHDRGDREVGHDDGAAAARRWPGAALVTTVGLGHRRILDDAHVVALVRDFVAGATATSLVLDDAARIERELADRELRRRCAPVSAARSSP